MKSVRILLLFLIGLGLQSPLRALAAEPIDRSVLFETIHKGYPLYIMALRQELDSELTPYEKSFVDLLISWTSNYPQQLALEFRDNPEDFVIKYGEPPRTARTTNSLGSPIFLNQNIINDPKVSWSLADAFQVYIHEIGHKVSYRVRTEGYSVDPLSEADQARIDRIGAKLRDGFEKHVQRVQGPKGEILESLHFPLQSNVSDAYTLGTAKIWDYDLSKYQIRILNHTATQVTDLTEPLFKALDKVPQLHMAESKDMDVHINQLQKWTVFETFQAIPHSSSTTAPIEIRLRMHELLYEGDNWRDQTQMLQRESINEAIFQGSHRLQQDLRFAIDTRNPSQASFRRLPSVPTSFDRESSVLAYRTENDRFVLSFKVTGSISAKTKVFLRGEFDNDVFIFPAKIKSKTETETIFEVRESIPSMSSAPFLDFRSVAIKSGTSTETVDLDRVEKLILKQNKLPPPRILSTEIEGQKLKITVESETPLQEIRLHVDEGRLRNADTKTLRHHFRRNLRSHIILSKKEFQQRRQGPHLLITTDLPSSQMPTLKVPKPIPILGWREEGGWGYYESRTQFEISTRQMNLSSIEVINQRFSSSTEQALSLPYEIQKPNSRRPVRSCRSAHR